MSVQRTALASLVISLLVCAGCSNLPGEPELGRIMREDDVAQLMQDLRADRAWVREHAALRLGRLEAIQAASELEDRLRTDPDPWVRARAAEALGAIGDPAAVEPLSATLADDSVDVRLAAVNALARIGGEEAHAGLAGWPDDPNLLVRGAARDAILRVEAQ